MDKEWEKLYEEAMSVLNPHDVSNKMWVGSVASAVLTKKGNIYKGICIDTDGSIGMCAERNALSTMLTYGESEIKKVVSVYKDDGIFFLIYLIVVILFIVKEQIGKWFVIVWLMNVREESL